jgi:hypothetical protein
MKNTMKSEGWNGTEIEAGCLAKVWDKHTGLYRCDVKVLSIEGNGLTEVEVLRSNPTWRKGDIVTGVGAWWLEGAK